NHPRRSAMRRGARIFLGLLLGSACSAEAASLPATEGAAGMVVTAQHLASEAGVAILRRGGNAVDAAVAVGYAEAVVNPCCGNIGGGGFMTAFRADGPSGGPWGSHLFPRNQTAAAH